MTPSLSGRSAAPLIALCLVLTHALAGQQATPGAGTGRIVIGVRADIDSLNIYTAGTILSQEVANLLFLHLATERNDFAEGPPTFAPSLARKWEFSKDGLGLVFHLDERFRWSDGKPVTAQDVVFSHEAATSEEVGWLGREVKDFISSVTAVDERTVRFEFTRRYPYQLMDAVEGNILPAHHYRGIPFIEWPKTEFTTAPVVSGPYRIVSYRQNEAIVLERNPRFGGEPAGIPRIVFRVIPDAATLLAELEAGGIDVLENVPAEHVERLGARPELVMHTVHDLSYTFICWNLRSPLFEDSRVRRALTLAIDRQAIIDGLLFGRGRTVATPIMSLYWAHDPSVQPLPYSPQRARELLGAAGWRDADGDGVLDKDGRRFEFILESNQGSKQRNDAAVMVQADLEKVGIAAQPRVIEWRRFLQKHEERDFDAFLGKYREATKVDLKSLLHSTAVEKGYNYGGYASEAMDRVIDEARVETDTSKAKALWARTQAIFHQEQPLTILFETERVNAVNRRISGVSMSPRSVFSSLTEWRLNEEVAASSPVGD